MHKRVPLLHPPPPPPNNPSSRSVLGKIAKAHIQIIRFRFLVSKSVDQVSRLVDGVRGTIDLVDDHDTGIQEYAYVSTCAWEGGKGVTYQWYRVGYSAEPLPYPPQLSINGNKTQPERASERTKHSRRSRGIDRRYKLVGFMRVLQRSTHDYRSGVA